MSLLKSFWKDESGSILCAEMVLLGTLGVVGATVGIKTMTTSINAEFHDLSFAFRSLDQSYSYSGFKSGNACTAGSAFVQQDVRISLAELQACEDACIVEQGHLQEKITEKKAAVKKVAVEKAAEKKMPTPAPKKKIEVEAKK